MVRHFSTTAGVLLAMSPMTASAQSVPTAGPLAELVGAYEEADAERGALYGVRIGYEFALGRNVVLGPEGEASNSTLVTTSTFRVDPAFVVTNRTVFGRTLYGGGRIALSVAPRVSIYARAGYVNRRLSGRLAVGRLSPRGLITEVANQRFQSLHDGLRVGVGTQVRLTGSLYGATEFRFDRNESLGYSHQTALTIGLRY